MFRTKGRAPREFGTKQIINESPFHLPSPNSACFNEASSTRQSQPINHGEKSIARGSRWHQTQATTKMGAVDKIYKTLKPPTSRDVPLKYMPVHSDEDEHDFPSYLARDEDGGNANLKDQLLRKSVPPQSRRLTAMILFSLFVLIVGLVALARAAWVERRGGVPTSACSSTTTVPQHFQTTPQIFAGPTATGEAPFLAANDPAPFGASRSFVANAPLETAVPITGNTQNASVFRSMGHLSPYFSNPRSMPLPSVK